MDTNNAYMNVLIDCGANIGTGYKQLKKELNITNEWRVYMFEPNSNCLPYLEELPVNFIFNQAVWCENVKRNLIIENNPKEMNKAYGINAEWVGGASHILEEHYIKPRHINKRNLKSLGVVSCVDFSEKLLKLVNDGDYVIVKMDIEGAEFCVLDKLIKTKVIKLINEIYIEWHERLIKDKNKQYYIDYFNKHQIIYHEWK